MINKGLYNYHGVVAKMYTGTSEENNLKYTVIKAYGQCEVDDASKPTGKRLVKQDITIYCHSGLSCYADAEIDINDKIMVVGKMVTKTKKKGGMYYYEQCIQAEELYKNDWLKYYNGKDK